MLNPISVDRQSDRQIDKEHALTFGPFGPISPTRPWAP